MIWVEKERTLLGIWMDKNKITQIWLENDTKLSRPTITSLCNDNFYNPNRSTRWRVITSLRKAGFEVYEDDFWQ